MIRLPPPHPPPVIQHCDEEVVAHTRLLITLMQVSLAEAPSSKLLTWRSIESILSLLIISGLSKGGAESIQTHLRAVFVCGRWGDIGGGRDEA